MALRMRGLYVMDKTGSIAFIIQVLTADDGKYEVRILTCKEAGFDRYDCSDEDVNIDFIRTVIEGKYATLSDALAELKRVLIKHLNMPEKEIDKNLVKVYGRKYLKFLKQIKSEEYINELEHYME